MSQLYVTETFGPTLQGEGLLSGTIVSFIRTAGCTVGCKTCDTKNSWAFGAHPKKPHPLREVSDLVSEVLERKTEYVVITGGEPLETENPDGLLELVDRLYKAGIHSTVELSGSVDPEREAWLSELAQSVNFWSFSPKVASMQPVKPPIPELIHGVLFYAVSCRGVDAEVGQLKFVVDDLNWARSLAEITALLQRLSELGCPTVPVILQTLTKPKDTPGDILARQRTIFELFSRERELKWGRWNPGHVRIMSQGHVLANLR